MNLEIEYSQVEADKGAFTILSTLLKAAGAFVSGSVLANQLGISRPAVWAKLEKLRGQGFEFEAVRNRGYRISKQPEVLHPRAIALRIHCYRMQYRNLVLSSHRQYQQRSRTTELLWTQ